MIVAALWKSASPAGNTRLKLTPLGKPAAASMALALAGSYWYLLPMDVL